MKFFPLPANHPSVFGVFTALAAVVLLNGCASVTARKVVGDPGKKITAVPAKVYVQSFAAPAKNLRVDRSGERLEEFQDDIAAKLSASLVKQLDRSLAPAEAVADGTVPANRRAWLITGRFDRVEQGSRALRALVGFGLGATKVVTTATIYDLSSGSPRRIMTIQTTGGSNAAPGTVVNLAGVALTGPAALPGMAIGAGTGALPGLGADVKRTAREITAVLSDYCYRRGFIFKEHALEPKPPGSGQLRIADPARPGRE